MRKSIGLLLVLALLLLSLTGCSGIGSKAASMTVLYEATAILSFLLLIGYCYLIREKNTWFLLLSSSVLIVNLGYLTLALSRSLEEALLANRVAYLGSVCLPMSMLMIIMNVCRLRYRRWFPGLLLGLGTAVFLIAASPGYLDIYYREVSLSVNNGMAVLEKVYGPWHCVYLVYLLAYFITTAAVIVHASAKRRIESSVYVVILAAVAFVNMGVWLLEQLVRVDFELLSVSYILSELFLLGLELMQQESRSVPAAEPDALPSGEEDCGLESAEPEPAVCEETDDEKRSYFASQLSGLTPTERVIYDYYLAGVSTKEIMNSLNIKENTLKYHNKNIYGKLGVCSRKQLIEIAAALKNDGQD